MVKKLLVKSIRPETSWLGIQWRAADDQLNKCNFYLVWSNFTRGSLLARPPILAFLLRKYIEENS